MNEWVHIPANEAYRCMDCRSIGNCSTQCPACASVNIYLEDRLLDRVPVESKKEPS